MEYTTRVGDENSVALQLHSASSLVYGTAVHLNGVKGKVSIVVHTLQDSNRTEVDAYQTLEWTLHQDVLYFNSIHGYFYEVKMNRSDQIDQGQYAEQFEQIGVYLVSKLINHCNPLAAEMLWRGFQSLLMEGVEDATKLIQPDNWQQKLKGEAKAAMRSWRWKNQSLEAKINPDTYVLSITGETLTEMVEI